MTAKPDIILLHGALGASAQLEQLAVMLRPHLRVHLLDFEGHGSAPARGGAITLDALAGNVIDALDGNRVERAHVFGYSMGGYVALHLALHHPERVQRIVTLGTKFRWDPVTAEREAARLDPATISTKVPKYAESLRARHERAGGWERVLQRTAAFLRALGAAPALTDESLRSIQHPAHIVVGGRDSTVTAAEAQEVAALMPNASALVLDNAPHPIEQVSSEALAGVILEFVADVPAAP